MKWSKNNMYKNCECETSEKQIQYKCNCKEKDCSCDQAITFEKEPQAVPFCCGTPMKRVKRNTLVKRGKKNVK